MLQKTIGIVLRSIKYSETSVITTIYTKEFGLRSFIVSGVRRANSKQNASAYQPLMLLELEIYFRENKNLLRIKGCTHYYLYHSLPFDVVKSAVGIFYVDILLRVIKEQEASTPLFNFIQNEFIALDQTNESIVLSPILFLINLSRYLGFYPQGTYNEKDRYFDLFEGTFVQTPQRLEYSIGPPLSKIFYNLIQHEATVESFSYNDRKELLHSLLNYYSFHNADIRNLHSLHVLEMIFK